MVDGQMKQDNIVAQKNFTFAAFFMPFCLVNPNNCVNTHTFARPLLSSRHARVIYNKFSFKQRVCKKFFQQLRAHLFCVYK